MIFLPTEMILNIYQYLDFKEVKETRRCCKELKLLFENHNMYQFNKSYLTFDNNEKRNLIWLMKNKIKISENIDNIYLIHNLKLIQDCCMVLFIQNLSADDDDHYEYEYEYEYETDDSNEIDDSDFFDDVNEATDIDWETDVSEEIEIYE